MKMRTLGIACAASALVALASAAAFAQTGQTCRVGSTDPSNSCPAGQTCFYTGPGSEQGECRPNNAPEMPAILAPFFLLAAAKVAHSARKRSLKKKQNNTPEA